MAIIYTDTASIQILDVVNITSQTASFSYISGSITTSGGLTGSLQGTASYSIQTLSASFATTASYALSSAGTTAFPFSGSAVITGSLTIYNSGSALPLLRVQGGSGQLFSVTDSFSGSLFSVNNISGIPLLEVTSDNQITLGNPNRRALITTAVNTLTASGAFTVYSIPTGSYDGAWFEYVAKSGSAAKAGQLTAVWSGSQVSYNEITTVGFGSTTGLQFTVQRIGGDFALTGSATTTGWHIKTIIRSI